MSDQTQLQDNSAVVTSGNIRTIVTEPESILSLEFEDVLFNLNSAVLLPYYPQATQSHSRGRPGLNISTGNTTSEQFLISGIGVIYTVYKFLELFPDYKIIIAGHSDTSGEVEYNFHLSELRAKNVLHILLGAKSEWVDLCFEKHKILDIQYILKHYSQLLNWNCDPGELNNRVSQQFQDAIKAFQESFNANYIQLGLTDYGEISVGEIQDGKLNKETWGAIYGLYNYELSTMLNCTPDDLGFQEWRSRIKFMKDDCKVLACGESFPIADVDRSNSRCQANRRVEILFALEDDIPEFECLSSRSEIYTYEDCPFYNFGRYTRNYLDRQQNFVSNIELQTVNPAGLAVGNIDLILHHQKELTSDIEVTTDSEGYWSRNNIPSGIYNVLYPDGTPLIDAFGEEEVETTINTAHVVRFLARIVIDRAFDDEETEAYESQQRIYRRSSSSRDGTLDARGAEEEVAPRRTLYYTTDNIALAAGWNSTRQSVDISKLLDVLDDWLHDYYPIVKRRGYTVILILFDEIRLYDNNKNFKASFIPQNELIGAFGAYSAFQHQDGYFLDMTNHHAGLLIKDHEDESYEIAQLLSESEAQLFNSLVSSMGNKIEIVYRTPDPRWLYALCLTGGMGQFEDYTSSNAINDRIHRRNLAVARTIHNGYPPLLENYIRSVETCTSSDEIRRLGPPPEPYQFPMPISATLDQYRELLNELGTNSFRAWVTISQKLDVLAGRIPDGTIFFRVKFTLSERVEAGSISPYDEVKTEWNFDVTEHGVFEKHTTSNTVGVQVGGGSGNRQIGVGANYEVDLESGEGKTSVNAKIGNWGIEASDDGSQKVTGPFGISSEGNMRRGEFGFGGALSTHDLFSLLRENQGQEVADDAFRNIPNAELYLGLHFQGLREDNILAVVSRAPGFFERRSLTNLLAQTTQWTDLNLDEKTHLEALGWNMNLWDRKYVLPFSQFPDSTRTDAYQLSATERIAIVHLGIRFDEWQNIWRTIAGT